MATSKIGFYEHAEYFTVASDSEYLSAGAKLIRVGGTCTILLNGLKNVPNGGWTTILTLPTGFTTTTMQTMDLLAVTDAASTTSFQTIRFQFSMDTLKVYNYGSLFTNGNWKPSIMYFV